MKKGKKMSKNKLHEYSIGGVMKAYELGGRPKRPKIPSRDTGFFARWKRKRHMKKSNCLKRNRKGQCVQPMP